MDSSLKVSSMPNWGSPPLKTFNVQEIAREQPQNVPERYMRSEEERSGTVTKLPGQLSIPVIDMANIPQGGFHKKEEICKIAKACEEWSFFQRVGKEFFHLPLEEKQKCALRDFQGYGQIFVVSQDQKLDWGDLLGLIISPPHSRNLSLWPAVPVDFRHIVDEYNKEITSLDVQLLSLIAETLHLKTDYFEHSFGNTYQKMRMNYYPPCPKPDHVLGLSPHADGSGITLLLQDDEIEGLHIRKDDKWMPVQPIPYALTVNIGSLLEVVNHDIPHSLMDDIKRVGKECFHLPLEEKQKCALRDFQGYGQIFVVSQDQNLDWGDLLGLIISPPHSRNLSLWPAVPADFRHIVDEYNKEIKSLAVQLLSLNVETLHLKTDYFEHSFGNTYQKMRMNYYPLCPKPDHVLGLSPHADGSGITLLLQDDEVEGLHIRKDDKWMPVQPIPYALVVNIGFLLEGNLSSKINFNLMHIACKLY